jgi:putative salt-induced outer membrane protein YdiY
LKGLKMHRTAPVVLLCVLANSAGLRADEVRFRNGDRLSGQILRLTEGKLVLKSQVAGEITVHLSDVQTFSSDAPLTIHLKDGTVLHQPVTAAEPNEFVIAAGTPLKPQTFALAQVESINPPPAPKPRWTGSITASVTSTSGNTRIDSVAASVSVARRTEKDRTTAGADYGRSSREDPDTGDRETTEDWWRARAQYDYFFTKKLFGFGNVRYEKDAIANLDRRIVVGGGAGYQWVETDDLAFSTSFGLASLYEKFDNQPDANSELSLQMGYNLNKRIWDNLRLVHDLTYYPSLDRFSDYFLTTTAELRASLTKNMFANFKVLFNYDATPAPDRGNTDVKYLLGVGMNF